MDKKSGIILERELNKILREHGAKLIGYGDMSNVDGCIYSRGVWVAIPVPQFILDEIQEGPTLAYREMYHSLNRQLNEIVSAGAEYLRGEGYQAFAQTTDAVIDNGDFRTQMPHKTVATRAGMGWIGKNCLLITPEYGPAIRMSSILTDAPLTCKEPINESKCGGCNKCVEICPGGALHGKLWNTTVDRDEIVDKIVCQNTQRKLMKERTGIDVDLCGQCFVVCPYTINAKERD